MNVFDARRATRDAMQDVTSRLIAEFHDVPPGSVITSVGRAREELLRSGVRDGLAPAVESMTRARLRTLGSAHGG